MQASGLRWPIGTLVNMATVTVGSLLGLALKNSLDPALQTMVFQAIGLATLVIGMRMCLQLPGRFLLGFIFSLLIGAIIGHWLGVDALLAQAGDALKASMAIESSRFSEGLVSAFILFCVGSMTIVGAIEEGIEGKRELLYAKSLLDGISSIAFAATYGVGVLFSILPMLVFQGGLTLTANKARRWFSPHMIDMITAVGGAMILGIGIRLLGLGQINVENLLPGLLVAVFIARLNEWLEQRRQSPAIEDSRD